MKAILLTQGYVAQVSDKDYTRVNQYKWSALVNRKDRIVKNVYAIRTVRSNGKRTTQLMHRFILGVTDPSVQVDHFPNHSGLNNQRNNLRAATSAENTHNQRLNSNNTSGFKGVNWSKYAQKWRAYIQANEENNHLGYFSTAEEAAHAYDIAALKYFGRFACTNQSLGLLPPLRKPVQSVTLEEAQRASL